MTPEKIMSQQVNGESTGVRVDRLLNKWAVEDRTSLDITTIYRKIKVGAFPRPVKVGKRRVAWRESEIAAWQQSL
jgi:prophage regulatory protein